LPGHPGWLILFRFILFPFKVITTMRRYSVTLNRDMCVQGQQMKAGDPIAQIESADVSSHVLVNLLKMGDATATLVDKSADYLVTGSGDGDGEGDDETPDDSDDGKADPDSEPDKEGDGDTDQQTTSTPDLPQELIDAGLPQKLVTALVDNAMSKDEPRLMSLDGLRQWVGEGNNLDGDLEKIGPKYAKHLEKVLFPESGGEDQ
jgi:hypothetical protein